MACVSECVGWGESANPIVRVEIATDGVHCVHPILRWLRLSATGYKFDIGESAWGWNAGAELKTRDNMFVLNYAMGNDRVDRTLSDRRRVYQCRVPVGEPLQGESPFTKPEPIFHSPRNLRYMLTQKVRRNWHQPTAVVATRRSRNQGAGDCGNLDRFLASAPWDSINFSTLSATIPIPPVPYSCLDPAKTIVVEFDYTFHALGGPGSHSTLGVFLAAARHSPIVTAAVIYGPQTSGHATLTLTRTQAVFTGAHADPSVIYLTMNHDGSPIYSDSSFINVLIRFNQ